MTPSTELETIAARIAHVAPEQSHRLRSLAIEVRKLERFADEIVSEAHEDERLSRGLRPVREIIEPIVRVVNQGEEP